MKQSDFKLAGQKLESIRKRGRSFLGTLDATIEISVLTPEREPPREAYGRRLDHCLKFGSGIPGISSQFRNVRREWNVKIDGLSGEVNEIEKQMANLLGAVAFIRGDAGSVLPDLPPELAAACRTLRSGALKGLSTAHIAESIFATAKSLDFEITATRELLTRVRSAGDLAVAKSMSVSYERAARSFGHDSRRGGAYLDLAVKAAADFKRGSADYAAKHFSATDNATKKLAKAVRAGSVNITQVLAQ